MNKTASFALIGAVFFSASAHAATFTVTNTNDSGARTVTNDDVAPPPVGGGGGGSMDPWLLAALVFCVFASGWRQRRRLDFAQLRTDHSRLPGRTEK